MDTSRYYAGIGSRLTPAFIQNLMSELARMLEEKEWILRSGGAQGADTAFFKGIENHLNTDIWRPEDATEEAIELTSKYHPTWDRCNDYAKKLHGRNAHIILGKDLKTPVECVICWTKNGQASGGTGQGIRIAQAHSIPVFNLKSQTTVIQMQQKLKDNLL